MNRWKLSWALVMLVVVLALLTGPAMAQEAEAVTEEVSPATQLIRELIGQSQSLMIVVTGAVIVLAGLVVFMAWSYERQGKNLKDAIPSELMMFALGIMRDVAAATPVQWDDDLVEDATERWRDDDEAKPQ